MPGLAASSASARRLLSDSGVNVGAPSLAPPPSCAYSALVRRLTLKRCEGSIAPIECISEASDGTIVCSRESDPEHACPTKLLWTKVRYAIVRTLQETTLADLVLTPILADGPMLPGAWIDTQTQTLTTGA